MSKKQFFIIIDTETTQDQKVADFGAVVCDRKGKIVNQCGILIDGIFTDRETHPLFFDSKAPNDALWSRDSADRRYDIYNQMVKNGTRMLATVPAVNSWLAKAKEAYNPVMTAYNLPFDVDKMRNTGIDCGMFDRHFCLWSAAFTQYAHSKNYRNFVLQCHAFNATTKHGNATYKTNAEIMARYVTGNPTLEDEPHTALEDIIFYELVILRKILKARSLDWLMNDLMPYNWRKCQLRDAFKAL